LSGIVGTQKVAGAETSGLRPYVPNWCYSAT